jgi:hypothetical protein
MNPLRRKATVGWRPNDQKIEPFQVSRVHFTYPEHLAADGFADSLRDLLRIPVG